MKSFLFLSFFFFLSSVFANPQATDLRIAIVGAGASGLTTAYDLQQKGYRHVTVFEREARVGGKVFSISDSGRTFELGAIWAGERYPIVEEFAHRYGVTRKVETVSMDVLTEDKRIVPITDFPLGRYPFWELFKATFAWQKVQNRFGYLRESGSFLKPLHPDLALPFDQFSEKYGIIPFAESFRPFWVACGYGYYDEVPALYVLKLMLESLDISLGEVLRQVLHLGRPVEKPLQIFVEGYQEIWNRVAADLPDVRLATPVEKLVRRSIGEDFLIEVTAGGRTETFDRVIISTDPRTTLSFLDATDTEKNLFGKVQSYRYLVHLFEADADPFAEEVLLLPDKNGASSEMGRLIALLRRSTEPALWTSLQLLPRDSTEEAVEQMWSEELVSNGITPGKVHQRKEWNYFPHVKGEALKQGFYQEMAQLQGQRGTYYVGGIWNFETVESTAAFARQLVNEHF